VSLAREGQIRREGSRRLYVYVSAEASRADEQMKARPATGGKEAPVTIGPPGTETVIAVLVEALHIGDVRVESAVVADRLTIRGIVVSREQVEDILAPYGLGKKSRGARSAWGREGEAPATSSSLSRADASNRWGDCSCERGAWSLQRVWGTDGDPEDDPADRQEH
jgi:hypothetical protein